VNSQSLRVAIGTVTSNLHAQRYIAHF
jgi:hypothetical protein